GAALLVDFLLILLLVPLPVRLSTPLRDEAFPFLFPFFFPSQSLSLRSSHIDGIGTCTGGCDNGNAVAVRSRRGRTVAVDMAVRITRLPEIFQMKASTENGENGFSLIEVLVAVFVLAVGVIGAAGMQLAALRTTQQSSFQTRALHLAAEMADYMRA